MDIIDKIISIKKERNAATRTLAYHIGISQSYLVQVLKRKKPLTAPVRLSMEKFIVSVPDMRERITRPFGVFK